MKPHWIFGSFLVIVSCRDHDNASSKVRPDPEQGLAPAVPEPKQTEPPPAVSPPATVVPATPEEIEKMLLDSSPEGQRNYSKYLTELMKTDPDRAVREWKQLPSGTRRWETLGDMIRRMDTKGGVVLLRFLATASDLNEFNAFSSALAKVKEKLDYEQLLKLRNEFGERRKDDVLSSISSKAIEQFGLEGALHKTSSDAEMHRYVMGHISIMDPSFYLDLSRLSQDCREDPDFMSTLLNSMANKIPKEGEQFVQQLGDPAMAATFVASRMSIDSQSVSAWIRGLPAGAIRTACIREMLNRMDRAADPAAYDAWAAELK
jgi:hypothetical protein